ncbi:MAG: hypothetical protein ACP5HC_06230 [Caldisericum sp.]
MKNETILNDIKEDLETIKRLFEKLIRECKDPYYLSYYTDFQSKTISVLKKFFDKTELLIDHYDDLNPLKNDLKEPFNLILPKLEKLSGKNVYKINSDYSFAFFVGTLLYAFSDDTLPLNENEVATLISLHGAKAERYFYDFNPSLIKTLSYFMKGFDFSNLDQEKIFRSINKTALSPIFRRVNYCTLYIFLLFFRKNEELLNFIKAYFSLKTLKDYDKNSLLIETFKQLKFLTTETDLKSLLTDTLNTCEFDLERVKNPIPDFLSQRINFVKSNNFFIRVEYNFTDLLKDSIKNLTTTKCASAQLDDFQKELSFHGSIFEELKKLYLTYVTCMKLKKAETFSHKILSGFWNFPVSGSSFLFPSGIVDFSIFDFIDFEKKELDSQPELNFSSWIKEKLKDFFYEKFKTAINSAKKIIKFYEKQASFDCIAETLLTSLNLSLEHKKIYIYGYDLGYQVGKFISKADAPRSNLLTYLRNIYHILRRKGLVWFLFGLYEIRLKILDQKTELLEIFDEYFGKKLPYLYFFISGKKKNNNDEQKIGPILYFIAFYSAFSQYSHSITYEENKLLFKPHYNTLSAFVAEKILGFNGPFTELFKKLYTELDKLEKRSVEELQYLSDPFNITEISDNSNSYALVITLDEAYGYGKKLIDLFLKKSNESKKEKNFLSLNLEKQLGSNQLSFWS